MLVDTSRTERIRLRPDGALFLIRDVWIGNTVHVFYATLGKDERSLEWHECGEGALFDNMAPLLNINAPPEASNCTVQRTPDPLEEAFAVIEDGGDMHGIFENVHALGIILRELERRTR